MWQPDLSEWSPDCRQYIMVARAIVDGFDEEVDNRLQAGKMTTKTKGNARIFPNPTSGILTVKLSAAACTVMVFDAFGRETDRKEATSEVRFDSTTWPSGIYTIEIREPGKRTLREKVLVQKL